MLYDILAFGFILEVLLGGYFLEKPLIIYFDLEKSWRTKLIGSFFTFMIMTLVLGLFTVLGLSLGRAGFTAFIIIFLLVGSVIWSTFRKHVTVVIPERYVITPVRSILVAIYGLLTAFGFYLLVSSRSGEVLLSPWQTISPYFIYIIVATTFLLGSLILLRLDASWLLGLLMVQALLMHSYLPLTHDLLYGADNWRHIATEERIMAGEKITDQATTDKTSKISFFIGAVSYGQLWGTSAFLGELSGGNLIAINKWLIVIIWSIFVPVLLFEIGRSLGWGTRWSLFFVWLSALPFAFQVGGSFSLPVNLGFVFWLGLFLLLLKRQAKPKDGQLVVLIGLGIMSLFGYSLFAVLFWLVFCLLEFLRRVSGAIHKSIGFALIVVFFPLLELLVGSMQLKFLGLFSNLKQFIGNILAFYLAFGPRPHDIATGNIIFNEVPNYAFVPNIYTVWHGWVVVFMLVFWSLVFWGVKARKFDQISLFTFGLLVVYFFRYIFSGEHVMIRRLDIVLAFLLLVLFVEGLKSWNFDKYLLPYVGIFALSVVVASSFSFGPDTRTVSRDEYLAMNYVWEKDASQNNHCVIADTYPLLALEAVSRKTIVGGGFPISSTFEQPLLAEIMKKVNNTGVNEELVKSALALTGASKCWLVGDFKAETPPQKTYGNIKLWSVEK